jgi:serine/threonine protein kinase
MEMEDSIIYLEKKDFLEKFPIEGCPTKLSSYADIYYGNDYVVKRYYKDPTLGELIKELNIYNIAKHQCIIKPLAWTVDADVGYLAMPKGKDIKQAYEDGNISMKRIIFDTLSALTYLNEATIVHGDIKYHNMLYFKEDDRCKLIDMGLARFAILNTDFEYYTTGVAYTLAFRNPNYCPQRWNNINCEIYALFSSFMFIESECKATTEDFGSLYNYTAKDPDLAWLLTLPMVSVRDLLNQVSKKFSFPLYDESKSVLNYAKLPFDKSPVIANLLAIIIRTQSDLDTRSLLLSFHIISRTFGKIFSKHKLKPHLTIAYCTACIELAIIINDSFEQGVLSYWCSSNDVEVNAVKNLYTEIIIDIIKITKGIIYSFSYWNYARCVEDIKHIIEGLIESKPIYVSIKTGNTGKNIELNNTDYFPPGEREIPLKLIEQPCKLNTTAYTYSLDLATKAVIIEDLIPLLLYNKKILPKLELRVAREIYDLLIKNKEYRTACNYVLSKICNFNWRINKILEGSVHPFRKLS